MNPRWQYKVVEVPYKLFGGSHTERLQGELDKLGALGWELVSVLQAMSTDPIRMFVKKEM
ncbi:MAG: DUF4177 domain-containing protein [Luteimonas sp.]